MAPLGIIGILIVATLIGSVFLKSYLEKRRIERARNLVDLNDDLRRMKAALSLLPDIYLDKPTRIFVLRSTMQMAANISELKSNEEAMEQIISDSQSNLEKALESQDDSVARLSKWAKITDPDSAQEMRQLLKFMHRKVVESVKTGLIPRAHGARVVKNLKVIAHRIMLDLNYCLGKGYYSTNKHRRALGKFRTALSLLHKSPIKQHLGQQKKELESLIENTEAHLEKVRKEAATRSAGSLASGIDKIEKEEEWEQKKNLYDR